MKSFLDFKESERVIECTVYMYVYYYLLITFNVRFGDTWVSKSAVSQYCLVAVNIQSVSNNLTE